MLQLIQKPILPDPATRHPYDGQMEAYEAHLTDWEKQFKECSKISILIGCEESQAICTELRYFGFNAYSCDVEECSGGFPQYHIHEDVRKAINGGVLSLQNGSSVNVDRWSMIILHCPCTFTAVCSNKHYAGTEKRIEAALFTKEVYELACSVTECVALEQPKTMMQQYIGKKSQIVQPYQYGHPEQKQTWLWLKGLPLLTETDNVYKEMMELPIQKRQRIFWMGKNKSKERSKTYPGIAKAIANQWGAHILNKHMDSTC